MDKLKEYRNKRNFDLTLEPIGGKKPRQSKRLKFAVQHHLATRDHYDFRLEYDGSLLSWAVPKGPSFNPKDKRLAVMVEDHPLDYADFEGTIPKGQYGGGTVMLWDEGYYIEQTDIKEGLKSGAIKIVLFGKRLKGKWALMRLKEEENNWLLIKENDEFALSVVGISQFDTGIRSGRTMKEIAQNLPTKKTKTASRKFIKNPFDKVEPMKAKLAENLPDDDGWLYEIKYDGYRILAFCENRSVKLSTRNNIDYTHKFPSVTASLSKLCADRAFVLDGEMVSGDTDGKSDFQALQNSIKTGGGDAEYMVFDLLAIDGEDLRNKPLTMRKDSLNKLIGSDLDFVNVSRPYEGGAREFFESAAEFNLEGIIGKRKDSVYSSARNGDWIKLKCYLRQEFVIGGYTKTDKASALSALLVGVYEGKKLVYCGRVGTGFKEKEAKKFVADCTKLKTDKSPFIDVQKAKGNEHIFWLKPTLIAEVQFAEWTNDNALRQASFKGLREDKSPTQVVREDKFDRSKVKIDKISPVTINSATEPKNSGKQTKKISSTEQNSHDEQKISTKQKNSASANEVMGVKISNPDKVVYQNPSYTKRDVAEFYSAVSKRMLPHIKDRIMTVVRCHNGAGKACFYNKHPVKQSEGVLVVNVKNSEGETHEYFAVVNGVGLIGEVQLGALEFHVWGSRADTIDKPDMLVFDLDPDEGLGLREVRQGVRDLKKILDRLKLKSYLKTSGGKGYHIVVPVTDTDWNTAHDFAREVALVMERTWNDRYTANSRKVKRMGRIYIDWARNGRGATSVAPYSLRAKDGAAVSMPIAWQELDDVAPNSINLSSALKRLQQPDPWKGYFAVKQKIDIKSLK